MKNKILKYLRLSLASFVFVLTLAAFYKKVYVIKIFEMQFTPLLQSSLLFGLSFGFVFLCFLFLLTFLFGRIYCSTLCPLGIFQDILIFLFTPFYKKRKPSYSHNAFITYIMAAALFGFLFGGSVLLLRMVDPYSVAGNALSGATYGLMFISIISVLVFFKKRFFCTHICPVGAVLGFISKFSVFKIRVNQNKCKMCSLCAPRCPSNSIDWHNKTVNNQTCIKCFRCLNNCSHGALHYGLPKSKAPAFSPKRRDIIKAGTILFVFGVAFKSGFVLSKKIASKLKNVLLPAGADNVQDFANRCLNCNLCVQNCPMKIIKPASKETPFVHINYGKGGYCAYRCNKCAQVCPSGAIKHLSLKEKQHTKIATAVIDEDLCIQCGMCAYECPKQIIIKKRGQYPIVSFESCIGCGKCTTVCPVQAISINPVHKQITLN